MSAPAAAEPVVLTELRIRNYAVIDDLRLELGPGLNVLTGETGAGKSIIVGALSLLLGERASTEVIRDGADRAAVEGVFDASSAPATVALCAEAGIDQEDGWLILRREVQREGRNRAWVNGSPATAGLVGALGAALVDLHGQHEHQALLSRDAQRNILDAYGEAETLARQVRESWETVRRRESELREVARQVRDATERTEYLRFKADEIEAARLEEGEKERLRAEIRRLEHSEELLTLSGQLHATVYGAEDSLVDRLGGLRRAISELRSIDATTDDFVELYEGALAALSELGRRSGEYRARVEHDPGGLSERRDRLDLIHRLERKYGGDLHAVVAAGQEARRELQALEASPLQIRRLEQARQTAFAELTDLCGRLSRLRGKAAAKLEEKVCEMLPALGMPGGEFRVAFEPRDDPGPFGAEHVEYRVSLNPGFRPGPLAKVASGGEMSRVMLAIKSVLAEVDAVPCLVFDEIDSGIGGHVAHRVAEQLADVASRHQVFAVTHLAQIAARADAHLRVTKVSEGGQAAARVAVLAGADRVREVARMLGGDPESETSLRHAEELLSVQAKGHA